MTRHSKSTFRHFITHVVTPGDNPRGDFIRDAREEIAAGRFPQRSCWASVAGHLRSSAACPEAMREAGRLWREYLAWRCWWGEPDAGRRLEAAPSRIPPQRRPDYCADGKRSYRR